LNLEAALRTAREGKLYPSVILDGGSEESRKKATLELARTLLCELLEAERPCGGCRHCRRIVWPEAGGDSLFHPDFQVLERDLKTSTSVDATRDLLRGAQVSPFEARGQVFVLASAESLGGEAANALLKALEEPHVSAPRHFFLLAPSRLDLLQTLRSRSLAIYLGPSEPLDGTALAPVVRDFGAAARDFRSTGATIHLLAAASALSRVGGWDDARSSRPWSMAAAAVVRSLEGLEPADRAPRLALAAALLEAPPWRLRGIAADRILEGLVARFLAAPGL
jgi:hypothetical protein